MDRSLLEQPLVNPSTGIRPACSPEEAARLRALSPEDYWLTIARELVWTEAPTKALEGGLGDFRYFPGAKGNVSVNCLDRWPANRVALAYERFRGVERRVLAGMTVNVPANAPHFFTNVSGQRSRMLCMCTPAGQEEFFAEIGTPLASRTSPAAKLGAEEQQAFVKKAQEIAPMYRTELLPP
jgi:hypothetical protein